MKAKLDKILNKFISKKLTVFIIATIFVAYKHILPEQWVNIAIVYIGSQAVLDAFIALRKK
jgi:hypothetical protein